MKNIKLTDIYATNLQKTIIDILPALGGAVGNLLTEHSEIG